MAWAKILSIFSALYKIIIFLIKIKKGQANFADIHLDYVTIEAYIIPDKLETITIRNIKKVSFNETLKTVTFVNSLGTFIFNVDCIKSIRLFDSMTYKNDVTL